MAVSASNLIQGPGKLYGAPFGSTEPLDTVVGGIPASPWVEYGATDGGVTFTVARTTVKLRMDQTTEAPGRRVTERDASLSTNLAEITLENLASAWGVPASGITSGSGYTALDVTGANDVGMEPDYRALIFDGPAPGGLMARIIGRRMLSEEDVEVAYAKDDQTFIPVKFAAHWVSASITSVHVVFEEA